MPDLEGQMKVRMAVDLLPLEAGFAQGAEASAAMARALKALNVPAEEAGKWLNKAGNEATVFGVKTDAAGKKAAVGLQKVTVAAKQADIALSMEKGVAGLSNMTSGAGVLSSGMGMLGGTIGMVGMGLFAMVEHLAGVAMAEQRMAEMSGMSVARLVEFREVMRANGVEANRFEMAITRLSAKIHEAVNEPEGKTAQAFINLGIPIIFLEEHGNNLEKVLMKVSDALHSATGGTEKLAEISQILGLRSREVAGVLGVGSEALQKQLEQHVALGIAQEKAAADARALKEEQQAIVSEIEAQLTPAISGLSLLLAFLASTFKYLQAIGVTVWDAITAEVMVAIEAVGGFARVMNDVVHGNFAAAWTDAKSTGSAIKADIGGAVSDIKLRWSEATTAMENYYGKAMNPPKVGGTGPAEEGITPGPKKGKASRKIKDTADEETLTNLIIRNAWDEKVAMEQQYDAMILNAEKGYEAQLATEEKAGQDHALATAQAAMRAKVAMIRAAHAELLAEQRAADEQQKEEARRLVEEEKIIYSKLDTAFNVPIAKMMTGQMTLQQFITASWQKISQMAIMALLHILEKHLVVGMAEKMLEGTKLGQMLANIAGIKAEAVAQAGLAGAAGTASFAEAPWPIDMGAPAFGASMFATAMGYAAFEKGGIVPETNIALVHRNEMVLPSHISDFVQQSARQSSGAPTAMPGGAGATHFHYAPQVSAFDSSGVKGVLDRHGELFAQSAARWMRGKNMG